MVGKGEIFRKDFCQPSSETESGEEVVETGTEQKETLNKRKRHKRRKKESNDKVTETKTYFESKTFQYLEAKLPLS